MPALPLTTVFDDLPDPRRDTRNKLHHLTDILVLATCAVLAGAEHLREPDDVTAHLRAGTEAGVTAGFHVIGDDRLQRHSER